ncbi:T9SS type A sorting domain-containing protein [bacterium]|nr:T9SS type A sorting domain-containing protein [bacterium]
MSSKFRHITILNILLFFSVTTAFSQEFRRWTNEWDDSRNGIAVRQADHVEWNKCAAVNPANGDYLVVWAQSHTGDENLYCQRYSQDGTAQWVAPVQLTFSQGPADNPAVICAEDGEWVVVWEDYRYDLEWRVNPDLYAQRINEDGELLWVETGVAVSAVFETQRIPKITAAEDGAVIIAWMDYRLPSSTIFVQKIGAQGNPIWEVNGIPVFEGDWGLGFEFDNFDVVGDESGGIIAAMEVLSDGNNVSLRVQRLDQNGNRLWENGSPAGLIVANGPHRRQWISLARAENNGVMVVWADTRNLLTDVYAQHIASNGLISWQTGGEVVCDETHWQKNPRAVSGLDGEVFVVWEDENVFRHLFMQKISNNNGIVRHWGEGTRGIPLSQETGYLRNLDFRHDGQGGIIATWSGVNLDRGEFGRSFVQLVNRDGTRAWEREERFDGIPLSLARTHSQQLPKVLVSVDGGFTLVYSEWKDGFGDIYHQRISREGDLLLSDRGEMVVDGFSGSAGELALLEIPETREAVYIWADRRRWQGELFLQKIHQGSGQVNLPVNGISITPHPFDSTIVSEREQIQSFDVQADAGSENLFVTWKTGENVFVQKVNLESITSEWSTPGVPVVESDTLGIQIKNPQLFLPGGGDALVVYEYSEQLGSSAVGVQYFDYSGSGQWGTAVEPGYVLTDAMYNLRVHDVFRLENGLSGVIYSSELGNNLYGIYALLFSEDGVVFNYLTLDEIILRDSHNPTIETTELDSGYVVCWLDDVENSSRILGQIINRDGEVLLEESGHVYITATGRIENFVLKSRGVMDDSFWLSWVDDLNTNDRRQRLQRFDRETNFLLFPPGGREVLPGRTLQQKIALHSDNSIYLVWNGSEAGNPPTTRFLHFDENANRFPAYPGDGLLLSDGIAERSAIHVLPTNNGGFAAAWKENRSGHDDEMLEVYGQFVNDGILDVSDRVTPAPLDWTIEGVYPNPFNASTRLTFQLGQPSEISIAVFDLLGRQVQVLHNGKMTAGKHHAVWQGINQEGFSVASGVYYFMLQSGEERLINKVILAR